MAKIEARLQPFIDDAFKQARAEHRHEEHEAYAFDALLRMIDDISCGNSRSQHNVMFIRADLEALKRGVVEGAGKRAFVPPRDPHHPGNKLKVPP